MWGGGELLTSSCLYRLYLIGPSFGIFQVRPPFDHEATTYMLGSQREARSGTGALLQIHQLIGKQKYSPASIIHAKLQSATVPTDEPSTPLLGSPSTCNYYGELKGGQTKLNTMSKDGGENCHDSWRNHKPRGTKRLEGYVQPTFNSTPQLTLITAILFKQMKVNRIWNFCHRGEIVFG